MRWVWLAGGFALGWMCCFGQGLWGSKLYQLVMDWRTWQGASPDQRARIRLDDDRHDVWPTDMRSEQ